MTREEKHMAVPLWEKALLTLEEASAYTGIGINNLRKISNDYDCRFVLWVGKKRMFKRDKLMEYLENEFSI
ncbi:MAG: transposase [Lachnospiraceae bacterium]|nr:transposase [Lachnospiraceae bacterium]